MAKIKPKHVVDEHLRQFFSQTSGDFITLEQAFIAWDRDLDQVDRNMHWLSNKLIHLRKYGYIESVLHNTSGKRGKQSLLGIKLTQKGKEVLGRSRTTDQQAPEITKQETKSTKDQPRNLFPELPDLDSTQSQKRISAKDLMEMTELFEQQNPGLEVVFDVRLKK